MSDYTEHLISMAGGDGDTVDQLAAIEARADKATGGVWKAWDRGIGYVVHGPDDEPLNFNHRETFTKSDAEFIAHARMDVPALLALARKQAAQIERALDLANTRSRCGWQISADEIRKALTVAEVAQ